MVRKDSHDFQKDYPGGYTQNCIVYDGNDKPIGYVTGNGDYRIKDKSPNNGNLYHNS